MKFLVSVIMLALLVSSAYAGKKKSGPLFIYPMPSYETQKQVKNKYVAQMICKTQTVYLRDSS
ncbi:MAG: hypothetical protein NTY22_08350, partial [Proteobacteria bacterium]|nr:hypothetical protein [Pseudomonadota bacterium]